MVDFTKKSNYQFYQTMKPHLTLKRAVETKQWNHIVKTIDFLDVIYTGEQLQYFKNKSL